MINTSNSLSSKTAKFHKIFFVMSHLAIPSLSYYVATILLLITCNFIAEQWCVHLHFKTLHYTCDEIAEILKLIFYELHS